MEYAIVVAASRDASAIAALHAESWRSAYRGLYPDEFLDGPILEERLLILERTDDRSDPERQHVIAAIADGELIGFACVLLDAEPDWSPLLDNLHVKPVHKGHGHRRASPQASREWIAGAAPGQPMHLWVMEGNRRRTAFLRSAGWDGRRADCC